MKKNNNFAFTLVELLAVIVILAIILVIAVPKVMSVIEDSKKATLESTAKMIASAAEKQKVQNTVLGNTKEITCDSVTKLNDVDYANCNIEFDNNTAKVTIEGSGKFDGLYVCGGTKINAEASEKECKDPLTALNFEETLCKDEATCTSNNLLKDVDGNIRYYGANPNNYIEFNDEVWRIIGVFDIASEVDGQTQKRIKIVRSDVLEEEKKYSDTQQWGSSYIRTYLNTNTEGNYYYTLSVEAKGKIGNAIWYDARMGDYGTPKVVYEHEQDGEQNQGIIGLIYISDYGYAGNCDWSVFSTSCSTSNWLSINKEYWVIGQLADSFVHVWQISTNKPWYLEPSRTSYVLPATYLNPNITITGTGENTAEGIYKIS